MQQFHKSSDDAALRQEKVAQLPFGKVRCSASAT